MIIIYPIEKYSILYLLILGIQISLHKVQTWINLHKNFLIYITQKRIQNNLKLEFSDDIGGNSLN